MVVLKQKALVYMTESIVPPCLPCRDHEKLVISNFIKQGIHHKGNTNSLYISGLPGLGKTACVYEVKNRKEFKNNKNFKFFEINCLKLKSQNDFYPFLLKLLHGKLDKQKEDAKKILNHFFTTGNWNNLIKKKSSYTPITDSDTTILLLVDEIDYLITKDQNILYTLFNWTHEVMSKLTIICIANTLDFPQKLQNKIGSRMGHERLIFKPYNSQNLQTIIESRLMKTNVFNKDAIKFVSKKIAAYSSDVRKSLHVCRLALKISLEKKYRYIEIVPGIIKEAFNIYNSDSLATILRSQSLPMKLILTSLLLILNSSNSKLVGLFSLYEKYRQCSGQVNCYVFDYYSFYTMVNKLIDYGILDLRIGGDLQKEVLLSIDIEILKQTLSEEQKIRNFTDFSSKKS